MLDHESFPTEGIKPAFFSPPPCFWVVFTPEMNPALLEELNAERELLIGIVFIYYTLQIYFIHFVRDVSQNDICKRFKQFNIYYITNPIRIHSIFQIK